MSHDSGCVGVLLAAGASRRFGPENKLLAELGGVPLVSHAAAALRASDVSGLIGVTQSPGIAPLLDGFTIVAPPCTYPEQSDSLRAGIAKAQELGASKAVIILGDMPFVTPALINAVIAHSTKSKAAAATDGSRPLPPVCFPAVCFSDLQALTGDRGASKLLADAALVPASEDLLRDIDTKEALKHAKNRATPVAPQI